MESTRQQKIARLIHKELADVFQKDIQGLFKGLFITITRVNVTPDLLQARVYLSLYNPTSKEDYLPAINKMKGQIKKVLGNKTRQQLRKLPDLEFRADDTLNYIENIDNLLKK